MIEKMILSAATVYAIKLFMESNYIKKREVVKKEDSIYRINRDDNNPVVIASSLHLSETGANNSLIILGSDVITNHYDVSKLYITEMDHNSSERKYQNPDIYLKIVGAYDG